MMRRMILTALVLVLALAASHAGEVQLTESPGDCRSPSWCSNGHVSFSSDRYGPSDIWAMGEDGESSIIGSWRITQNPANTDYEPAWNAGCTHVYFSGSTGGGHRLYYISSVGFPAMPIAVSLGSGNDRAPDHSPTAGAVVFHSDRAGNDDIMWMPQGGESTSTYLTTHPDNDRSPSWSPDGSVVAFASNRSGNWDIWLMDAGGESRAVWQLTSAAADETLPDFNPTGDLVAFHRAGVGIVAIDVEARLEYQLTTDPTDTEPCWSPDGTMIAFSRESGGEYHIWTTDNVPDTAVEQSTWGQVKALYR